MYKLQQEDPSLVTMRKWTKEGSGNEEGKRFFYQEGLLVHSWPPKNSTSEDAVINQLRLHVAEW